MIAIWERTRFWRENGAFLFGVVLFGCIAAAALLAPGLTPHDPMKVNLTNRMLPPSWMSGGLAAHPLGTDAMGRDLLTRLMYGGPISLALATSGVVGGTAIGLLVGLSAGFIGRWVDAVLMRVVDVQMAFPILLLALVIVAAFGPSTLVLVVLLIVASWVLVARVVRGMTLQENQKDYVRRAVVLGASPLRIAVRYVLPNILPTIAVTATLQLASLIMFEATLSFLGVGIQPPTPSWGGTMMEGQQYMRSSWWVTTMPGIALFATALGLNLLSEGLSKILDPRMQR